MAQDGSRLNKLCAKNVFFYYTGNDNKNVPVNTVEKKLFESIRLKIENLFLVTCNSEIFMLNVNISMEK